MLAQLPRIPVFPQYMVKKLIAKIEKEVQDQIIPVSSGIYSEHKLREKLAAIPKPILVNYESKMFYEVVDPIKFPRKTDKCPTCFSDYNKRKTPVQCAFCGLWNCSECICHRLRFHPRAKDINSQRYHICYPCDDKFLCLEINHGFVTNKLLLEESIKIIKNQCEEFQQGCDKKSNEVQYIQDSQSKNSLKLTVLNEQQSELRKIIKEKEKEQEDLEFRIEIRRKYKEMMIEKLKEKKELETTAVREELELSPPENRIQQFYQYSPNSHLEIQDNVYNETINVPSQEMFVNEDEQENHEDFEEKRYYQPQQEEKQEETKNFYNYDEWKNEDESDEEKEAPVHQQPLPEYHYEEPEQQENKFSSYYEQLEEKEESPSKLAELFKKTNKKEQKDQRQKQEQQKEDQEQEQEISKAKLAVMKEAFQSSRKSRQKEFQLPTVQQNICTCNIY